MYTHRTRRVVIIPIREILHVEESSAVEDIISHCAAGMKRLARVGKDHLDIAVS